jgi:hypothetical protein
MISNNPDFSSILQVDGKLFGVTHFEAPSPGTAYLSQYEQNAKTGAITVGLGFALCCLSTWRNPCCSSALQKRVAQRKSWPAMYVRRRMCGHCNQLTCPGRDRRRTSRRSTSPRKAACGPRVLAPSRRGRPIWAPRSILTTLKLSTANLS